jgi:prepilin-type N-terminal cleavage/methylation domain-containing protein
MKRTRRNGFTLIEVLAVVFLTAILFGAAVNYYVELSTRSNHAAETTRQWRHATALLDRVAADLERAYLVRKPEERDPLDHPWLFLAETRYAEEGGRAIRAAALEPAGAPHGARPRLPPPRRLPAGRGRHRGVSAALSG